MNIRNEPSQEERQWNSDSRQGRTIWSALVEVKIGGGEFQVIISSVKLNQEEAETDLARQFAFLIDQYPDQELKFNFLGLTTSQRLDDLLFVNP